MGGPEGGADDGGLGALGDAFGDPVNGDEPLGESDAQDTALGEALDSGLEQGGKGGDDLDPADMGDAGGADVVDEVGSDDDGESGGSEPDMDPG